MRTHKVLLGVAIVATVFSILGCNFAPIQDPGARPPGEVQIIPSDPVVAEQDPEVVAKAIGDYELGERMVVERMVERALADYELGERMTVERLVERALNEYRAGERAVEAVPLPAEAPGVPASESIQSPNIWFHPGQVEEEIEVNVWLHPRERGAAVEPESMRTRPPNVWLTPGRVQEEVEGNIWWSPASREMNAAPVEEGVWSIYRSGERSLPQAPSPENAWEAYRLGERTAVAPEAPANLASVGIELTRAGSNVSEADLAWAAYRAAERTLDAPLTFEDAWAAYRSGERAPTGQPAPADMEVDLSTW